MSTKLSQQQSYSVLNDDNIKYKTAQQIFMREEQQFPGDNQNDTHTPR